MPETVCVTVEQLREIERGKGDVCPTCKVPISSPRIYETDADGQIRYAQCGLPISLKTPRYRLSAHKSDCWLAKAIAQAERLKDWTPKVGDRVRLKAMPVLEAVVAVEYNGEAVYIDVNGKRVMRQLAELMPEEGE